MPTSAQSAVSASASVCVDGSDCDREPARDNVIPRYMNDHRRPTAKARRLDCDSRSVDRDQLAFDHGLCFAAVIANVHAIAMKAFVLLMRSQWALRTRRTHQEYERFHGDRKSTRLNSSHLVISYAVFCL